MRFDIGEARLARSCDANRYLLFSHILYNTFIKNYKAEIFLKLVFLNKYFVSRDIHLKNILIFITLQK